MQWKEEGVIRDAMDTLTVYHHIFLQYLNQTRNVVNEKCSGMEPWQVIASTIAVTLLIVKIHMFLFQSESLTSRFKKWFFRFIRKLPIIGHICTGKKGEKEQLKVSQKVLCFSFKKLQSELKKFLG